MKVAFYLNNLKFPHADLTTPPSGNPGIGGTHFLVAALPYYIEQFAGDDITPILYANYVDNLPIENVRTAPDVISAMRLASREQVSCFVDTAKERPVDVVAEADRLRLPTIFWLHNIVRHGHLRAAARSPYLRRVVCCGNEALDYIRDHCVAPKLALIQNGLDQRVYKPSTKNVKDGHTVTYLGSIVKQKGFHILARAWPSVLERCPWAKLRVIGSAQLYDRSATLGPWGIASDAYERKFLLPFLADSTGTPNCSVEFQGLMTGTSAIPLLQESTVGIVNPSGETENCPGSALEFQASGTPVVSGAYWGLLDTVVHNETGLLGRTDRDLVDNICRLLEDRQRATDMGQRGIEYVSRHYDYRDVVAAWVALLRHVSDNRRAQRVPPTRHLGKHMKWLRISNETVKRLCPALWRLPSVSETEHFLKRAKKWITSKSRRPRT